MTSFVHTDYPREHPGVARAEAAIHAVADIGRSFDSAKTLATLLSAAVVAALVVVADRLIDTWADGHLLATWVIMWAVAFAALGFLAPMVKDGARGWLKAYAAWAEQPQCTGRRGLLAERLERSARDGRLPGRQTAQ